MTCSRYWDCALLLPLLPVGASWCASLRWCSVLVSAASVLLMKTDSRKVPSTTSDHMCW